MRLAGREPPGQAVGGTGWLLDAQVQREEPTVWKDLMGPLLMAPNITGRGHTSNCADSWLGPQNVPLEPAPPLPLGAALVCETQDAITVPLTDRAPLRLNEPFSVDPASLPASGLRTVLSSPGLYPWSSLAAAVCAVPWHLLAQPAARLTPGIWRRRGH